MRKTIKAGITSIIIILATCCFAYAMTQKQASAQLQTFYKNPSYTKLNYQQNIVNEINGMKRKQY